MIKKFGHGMNEIFLFLIVPLAEADMTVFMAKTIVSLKVII